MSQTIALQVRSPQFSLADVERKAQEARMNDLRIHRMEQQQSLDDMKMRDAVAEGGALERYRSRRGNNDPNAIKELDPYPELQEKLGKVFDGMSPEDFRATQEKAKAFGSAAKRVASFAEGSPQQAEAWVIEIDKLFKQGYIDEQSRDLWAKQGPNMAIINEAISVDDFVSSYTSADPVKAARIRKIQGDIGNAEDVTKARVGRYDKQNEKTDWDMQDDQIDNGRDDRKAESLDTYRKGKLGADTADDQADNTRADADLDRKITKDEKQAAEQTKRTEIMRERAKNKRESRNGDGKGDLEGGLSENEYGRRQRDIQKRLNKLRDEGADEATISAERKRLMDAYNIKPKGTTDDPVYPASPEEAAALAPGTYFVTPSGKLKRR